MVINTILASNAFDPYPFILLNLVLSCVAAIQAPENDYKVNLKTEIMIEDLYDKVNAILAKQSVLEKKLQEQEEQTKS